MVLESVRAAQPSRFFVALDGPRPGDEAACEAVRRLVADGVDWPCELELLQRETNLGCRWSVSGAIDWFFEHVERGIILEDDTVPSASFYPYCDALLEKFENDEDIWMVSGVNLLGRWESQGADYFFGHGGIWGWATWRRAWTRSDVAMTGWRDLDARARAAAFMGERDWTANRPLFESTADGAIDSWGYGWSYSRAAAGGLSAIPVVNLVRNVGFRSDASHTVDAGSPLAHLPASELSFPLRHPRARAFDRAYQGGVARIEHPSLVGRVRGRVTKLAGRIR